MASTRSRQRKLARDKYERQLVRRAQRQRRRRQIQAGVGVLVLLALIVAGGGWLAGWFDSEPEPVATDLCTWVPQQEGPGRVEAGTPPANPPESGSRVATIDLAAGEAGSGTVEMALDVAGDPCGVASLEHLAAQGFYDSTTCHELSAGALHCGDPAGTGAGGPTYGFWSPQNLPEMSEADGDEVAEAVYPAGTVALNEGAGGAGSQFVIFYEDFSTPSPGWSILGQVTGGMDLVTAIGAAGTDGDSAAPAETVEIRTLTITDLDAESAGGVAES